MLCPKCGEDNNRVIQTRKEETIKRQRICRICNFVWMTEEKIVFPKEAKLNCIVSANSNV